MPDLEAQNGRWLTARELRNYLLFFPADTPITAFANDDGSDWLNIDGATDPRETDEPSIILWTRNNFDTRQF
jgi:hypothetical protein